MPNAIETRLADMGLALPAAPAPAANYVPWVISGNQIFVSGQVSQGPDGFITGKLGADMDVPAGAAAAKRCAISLLAQVKAGGGTVIVATHDDAVMQAFDRVITLAEGELVSDTGAAA